MPLTAPQLAAMLAAYPTADNRALAAEYGITKGRVGYLAALNGVRKTAEARNDSQRRTVQHAGSLCERIRGTVAAAGAAGIDIAGVRAAHADVTTAQVAAAVNACMRRATLFRTGTKRRSIYFASAAFADAHTAEVARATFNARPRPAAGPSPARTAGEPVITPATRRTVCPSAFDPAFAPAPAPRKPDSYLMGEVSPWVAALTSR